MGHGGDAIKERRISGWREYLKETRGSFDALVWVWKNLISDYGKRTTRRMLIISVFSTVVIMSISWVMKSLVDSAIAGDFRNAAYALATIAGVSVIGELLDLYQAVLENRVSGDNSCQVDCRTADMFFEKSLGQHLRENSSLSSGNLERGKGRVVNMLNMLLFNGQSALFNSVIPMIWLWVISPVIGLVLTVVLAVFTVWSLYLNRRAIVTCTPFDAEFRRINRHRFECFDKIERVKTGGKENEESERIRQWSVAAYSDEINFWVWFIRNSSMRWLLWRFAQLGILAFVLWRIAQGDWTVGLLFPIYSWSQNLIDSVQRLSFVERQINYNLPAVQTMIRVLTIEPDIKDEEGATELEADVVPDVELRNVKFAYEPEVLDDCGTAIYEDSGAEPPKSLSILDKISFRIEPGEKVALLGPSGIGKTTVMRVVQRYFDPSEGQVLVNGKDLRDVKLSSWQRLVGYIAQNPQVMDGTIRSNLLYGLTPERQAAVSDEDLWSLVRKLKIDFGERLTDGLNTKVGRHGIKLSGGEQQRLMIGAVAMKNPRFWIIDEATSSLDSTTEKAVQEGLADVMEDGASALVIAHRLSTVRHLCSKFVVLKEQEGGSIVEAIANSFEELYQISTTFRRLADDQGLTIGK